MNWNEVLIDGEQLLWEGRPAPRCFVFRQWQQALFGGVFLLICLVWQAWGVAVAEAHDAAWAIWLPLPFVLIGLYFSVGRLIAARLEWPHAVFAITDRRVLVQRGLLRPEIQDLPLSEVTYFKLVLQAAELGTLSIYKGDKMALTLPCVEYPRRATQLLEAAMGERARAAGAE